MKRILVPTDFSEHAENALKAAVLIAKKTKCELFILHLLEVPNQINDTITGGSSIPEEMLFIKKANEKLQKITEQPYLAGISVNVSVQYERTFSGILAFNKKNKIDLIVMGSHGTSGIEELLLGSNTEKVVRLSEIPVLVIKKDVRDLKFKNMVFASDFSPETKKPFIKMRDFAAIFDANLFLVFICTPNSFKTTLDAEKIMSKFIKNYEIKNYSLHIFNDTNVENGIVNFSKTIDADLIGLCTHGRTGLAHFFTGSISEDLVNHVTKPIITFKI
ncbi:Nucleotide-binding universal stress protein, UspA family [Flavobacterium fryxellicola]|uniref:Universal stress protein UspA n=1 Tax=Flavobacterium fryxellicola TaxID=249352 RepID=A0A167X9N5_9FLAO|nr:universal stress protein [Flavobacterium fryxellicola]OAB28144.1 universal stress protein UspA [Flavobacterium fryxellicola]SHN63398.1 Nucleotide-binding universal stress protein, UspA family [Flavobacterium fryxellicola]